MWRAEAEDQCRERLTVWGKDKKLSDLLAKLTLNGNPQNYVESKKLNDTQSRQEETDKEWEAVKDHDKYDWVNPEDVSVGEEII